MSAFSVAVGGSSISTPVIWSGVATRVVTAIPDGFRLDALVRFIPGNDDFFNTLL